MTHIGDRLFDISKDPFGILDELRPGLRQADLPGRSEKQPGTKFMFQRRDPFRQGGLAQPCPRDLALFRAGGFSLPLYYGGGLRQVMAREYHRGRKFTVRA